MSETAERTPQRAAAEPQRADLEPRPEAEPQRAHTRAHAHGSGPDAQKPPADSQWQDHRVAALALRLVVSLCPVAVAVLVGLAVSRALVGGSPGAYALRVAVTALVSVTAFVMVERLARRFLPLAALLRLNLVFPDRAPSRFSVALRSTSVRKLEQWVSEARATDDATVLAERVVTLASALNTHDRRTRGHCERTRALADLIVEEMRLSPVQANEVRWGAFLHDIGKLAVPSEILNKPGKPTDREWEILRSHPEAGAKLVAPLRAFLHDGVDAVGSHHENFDGSGYPAGLAGEELPLAARIVSVADAFEVMTAVRAYKRPMSLQAARTELALRSGSQFDPQVVRAFLNVSLGRVHWTLGLAAWVAELPFLTLLPRVAAQVSTTAGAGGLAPAAALPTVAAASIGAMAVLGPGPARPVRSPEAATASARPRAARSAEARSTPVATGGVGAASEPAPGALPSLDPVTPAGSAPIVGSVTSVPSGALGTVTGGGLTSFLGLPGSGTGSPAPAGSDPGSALGATAAGVSGAVAGAARSAASGVSAAVQGVTRAVHPSRAGHGVAGTVTESVEATTQAVGGAIGDVTGGLAGATTTTTTEPAGS